MNEYIVNLIKESVSNEKSRIARERRKEIHRMLNYYEGSYETKKYIKDKFSIKAFKEVPCSNFNITRRFIDRMSRIYTQGAKRNVNEKYDKMTWIKDAKMKHIEKMTRLLGTVAVQVVVKEKDNGNYYFDYIPIYAFDVHFGNDPFEPISIVYPILQNVSDISYDSFNKVYVMVKCRVCMKLIGPSSPVIKCSRGFLQDDMIIEDSNIIVHLECYSEAGD